MSDELRGILWPKGHRPDVWAIVDSAQDQRVYWTLTNSFLPHCCLFAGALPEALEMAAPYLVQLDPDDKFTDYLGKNLQRNLAVFLRCDATLAELRRHLRSFLTVKDSSGRKMLFRYYDPRVLRVYLPTCTNMELQTVFGPVKAFWTVGENPNELTQFEFRGKDMRVTQQQLGMAEQELPTRIAAPHSVLAIPHGAGGQTRVPVQLQGVGRGGRLRRSGAAIRFYRTISAPEELPFVDGVYTIPPAQLDPDVTVYAEAASRGEVSLTLETLQGGRAETKLQAVQLRLESGSAAICVGTTLETRRRLDVPPPGFAGRLTLRGAKGLTLYASASAQAGYPLNEGFSFDAPAATASFWLEGEAAGPGHLELCVEGSPITGARRDVTVATIAPPEQRSVTLLSGAGAPLPLAMQATPAGLPAWWSVERRQDDSEDIRAKSGRATPTVSGDTLLTDAAGSFLLRAKADESAAEWGGPSMAFEVNLVRVALAENRTSVNSRFCRCVREAETHQFRLDCGPGGITFDADAVLTGGGPDGQRGLDAIRGGWVHRVVSDNSGARYKGGGTRQAKDTFALETVPASAGTLRAFAAPAASWPVVDNGAIEQIWRYLEVQSDMAFWSADAPEQRGTLLRIGWSFTGDYHCGASKTTRTVVPARLATIATAVLPSLTDMEELRDRQED